MFWVFLFPKLMGLSGMSLCWLFYIKFLVSYKVLTGWYINLSLFHGPFDPSFLTSVSFIYQRSTGNASSSSSSEADEGTGTREREGYICAVCLDVYFSPYMCHPCNHIFCEPCLRTLARNSPANTPCPLCRTVITHVFFQKGELTGMRDFLHRSLHL